MLDERAQQTPETHEAAYTVFNRWIRQRPGLDFGNYQTSDYRASVRAYRAEVRAIGKQRQRALRALETFRALPYDRQVLADVCRSAYSGRLSFRAGILDYTTGQYWPTEYRAAAASVLETYNDTMHRIVWSTISGEPSETVLKAVC